MVPHSSRGHSFKGCGQYYFHDKKAETSERVEWVHTHNLPTDDPQKAMKWMAYTAMNADKIKQEAGIKNTGRKSELGAAYTYSLSWHPDEKPDRDHMQSCAMETLELLGLKDHEAVFVSHSDRPHKHVHVIVNLVSPVDGRMNTLHKDHLKLSKWAESYEKEQGRVYCEQRVENNRFREQGDQQKKKDQYKVEQQARARQVYELYANSKDGNTFQSSMKLEGFELAQGNRRNFVFIDEQGRVHSLSRHLKLMIDVKENKTWRTELRALLAGHKLPDARDLSEKRKLDWDAKQYFDREKYEAEWQKGIVDGAIEESEKPKKPSFEKENEKSKTKPKIHDDIIIPQRFKDSTEFLDEFDRLNKLRNKVRSRIDQEKQSLKDNFDQKKETNDNQNELKKRKEEIKKRRDAYKSKKDKESDRDLSL